MLSGLILLISSKFEKLLLLEMLSSYDTIFELSGGNKQKCEYRQLYMSFDTQFDNEKSLLTFEIFDVMFISLAIVTTDAL